MCIHLPATPPHDKFPQSSESSSYVPLPNFYLNEFQTVRPPCLLRLQPASEGVASSKKRRSRSNLKQLEFMKHRDVLKRLYIHEKKTLDDVMGNLKSKHGFEAR